MSSIVMRDTGHPALITRRKAKNVIFALLHFQREAPKMLAHDTQGCGKCRFCRSKNLPLCQIPSLGSRNWEGIGFNCFERL
jgi:hypothetical protein